MQQQLKARILLVDDEEEFLVSLKARLEIRGMQVDTAANGEDAISLADRQEYDAIIVDLSMPGIDGLETLERIKEINPDAELIMLTGHATVESGIKAMKKGAGDFLQKPVDLADLLQKIGEAKDRRIHLLEKKSQEELDQILKSRGW
ncbi:MAG: response regulator [Desulfopila sp.]